MNLKTVFKAAFLLLLVISCSPKVPFEVQESFTKQFKNPQDVCWLKTHDSTWEVSFYQRKFYYKTVAYSDSGKWMSTRIEVSEDSVPKQLLSALTKQVPEAFLIKIYNKNTSENNQYQLEILSKGKVYVVAFDTTSKLVVLEKETDRARNDFVIEND
ncbi:hypothetical protein [Olleya marilimosa]|uniref:hypothetical protein n=1 Tax=Olleya marilimosa TaxID=272164 RepID=UPI0004823599|nr:hypothetical protein [Olleya marilimosa]